MLTWQTWRLAAPLVVLLVGGGVAWAHSWLWRRRLLRELRSTWGHLPGDRGGIAVARALHDIDPERPARDRYIIDDRTWEDLDCDHVFAQLDRCVSPIGSQTLYKSLRSLHLSQNALDRRHQLVELISRNHILRERLQLCLTHLRSRGASRVAELLWREPPGRPAIAAAAPVMALIAVVVLALAWAGTFTWAAVFPVLVVNGIVHFAHRRGIDEVPLGQLGALIGVARRIAALESTELAALCPTIRRSADRAAKLARALALLSLDDGLGIVQYLKIYFLIDVLAYSATRAGVQRDAAGLRSLFEEVGMLDAAQAIASYLTEQTHYCPPEFTAPHASWGFAALRHPLLASPVPYDFSVDGRGVLVTGSNMSGKTTFLKAIAVNAVLAQSWYFALAERYTMPHVRPLTAIGRSDNLIEGKSYYLAEVESILRLVRASASGDRYLLVADELFRGTNPEERIAGAAEVLRFMANPPHFVFAATHDADLVRLLCSEYSPFHFTETLDSNGLSFDYAIRPGACTSRNAIALLEHVGYPDAIVTRARSLAEALERGAAIGEVPR